MSAPAPQALIISTNAHYDVETGDLISSARIQEITNRLVEAGTLMDASQKTWIDEIKSNGGDKAAAATLSNQVLPGGKTRLFDKLSRNKCLANLLIIGPPVILEGLTEKEISKEYQSFQTSVLDLIIRLAPGLNGLIFDLFTSRKQKLDNGFPASFTYCRFPYYLGCSVVTLCGQLNISAMHQFNLKAKFFLGDGRQQLGPEYSS